MNLNEYYKIKENELCINNTKCSELAKKYGTPLYVYNQNKIEDIATALKKSLDDNYGFGEIHYASKAFCCKEVYRIINKLGLGIDIVSGGELFTASSVDFPMDKVIFHGNNKSKLEIEQAVKLNVGLFVIDSFSEAEKIDAICQKLGRKQNVLIRINPGVEAHTHEYIKTSKTDSKFGFSIESGEAEEVVKNIQKLNNVNLVGFHCHIGSQIFEKQSFLLSCDIMMAFYNYVINKLKINVRVLDLGGGFGIWYNEDDTAFNNNDYYEFIKTILERVKENTSKYQLNKPYIIFEPGRSIVGEAGTTLYTVGSIKQIKNVKTYLAVDGGMFENPRFALYGAKYSVVAPTKINEKCEFKYSIAGKCCESGDKIREDCYLPKINEGDILAVLSTGAYHYSMASNYNKNTIPPVVFVKDNNDRVVVKGQTYQDLIKNDI